MARFYTINDPEFSEFVFHVMRNASAEQKRELSANELKYFNTEEDIRRFADNETLDKRLLMLVRIGHGFTLTTYPLTVDIQNTLAAVPGQYQLSNKRRAIIETMAKDKVFVLGSRELTVISHMAAQNSHSQVYVLDYAWLHMRDKLNNYRIKPFNEAVRDSIKETEDLSKLMLHTLSMEDIVQSITGCTKYEMKVLLAMYPYRNTMISHDTIAQLMSEPSRSTGVSKVCSVLCDKEMIAREPGYRGKKRSQNYMIMETGITAVMNYIKYVLKKST